MLPRSLFTRLLASDQWGGGEENGKKRGQEDWKGEEIV